MNTLCNVTRMKRSLIMNGQHIPKNIKWILDFASLGCEVGKFNYKAKPPAMPVRIAKAML